MSRTVEGERTFYLYDGHEDIGSYDNNKKCIDLKILSAKEGSIPIAMELKGKRFSPNISSQGHIVGLVEMHTGKVADESFLTLFGRDLSDKSLSPWRFCGKRHEDALGIIDFGYRFYHPKTAQWLTQDPIGESDGPNLYAYVKNNPACHVDRFGLFMDDFSFSSSWESFKDTCSECWSGFKDSCTNGWENVRDGCSSVVNQVAGYNIPTRFCGVLQTTLGVSQFISGMS